MWRAAGCDLFPDAMSCSFRDPIAAKALCRSVSPTGKHALIVSRYFDQTEGDMKFSGLLSINVLSSVVVFESSGCNMSLSGWLKTYIN